MKVTYTRVVAMGVKRRGQGAVLERAWTGHWQLIESGEEGERLSMTPWFLT